MKEGKPTTVRPWTRQDWLAGHCKSLPSIMFLYRGKQKKLHFFSVKERESFYKDHLRNDASAKNFIRFSVLSHK